MDPQRFTSHDPLVPGDPIFHPKCGFGTIHGLMLAIAYTRSRSQLRQPGRTPPRTTTTSTSKRGGPCCTVSRADSVGLRRLTNGVEAIQGQLALSGRGPASTIS